MRAFVLSFVALTVCCVGGCRVQYRPMEPFTSKEGNFTCVFPGGDAKWRTKLLAFPAIQVAEAFNPGIEFAAGYGDFVFGQPKPSDLPRLYDEMKTKVAAEAKGTIVSQGEVWIDGFKGYEFMVKLPGDDERYAKMRALVAGKRVYMFGIVAEKSELHSADAQRFMQSFKLIDKPKVEYDFSKPGMSGTQNHR